MNDYSKNILLKKDADLNFDEFPGTDYQTWKTEVERLLKGAPFEKKMKNVIYEGIELEPIYRLPDIREHPFANTFPGFPPFIRAANVLGYHLKSWNIAQKLPYPTAAELNKALVYDIERGQGTVSLKVDKAARRFVDPDNAETGEVGRNGTSITSIADIEEILRTIDIKRIPIHLQCGSSALPMAALIFGYLKKANITFQSLKGCIKADPISELAATGELPISIGEALDEMAYLVNWLTKANPDIRTIAVDASVYHNSGGSAVEELAYSLATGVTYLKEMDKRNIPVKDAARQMVFIFSVGSNFFMEIAKLRAARMLWSKIISECGGDEQVQKMMICSKTSFYNKSTFDPHVNLLRATTEAFSAVVGGCDSLHVGFFDDTIKQPDEFSRRIARNIQIILKEESHLEKIIDPAGGSWYVENLTRELAHKAWDHFQEIEKSGGMIEALKAGIPQKQIEETNARREKNIARRKDVIVGTNMYANLNEKPIAKQAPDYAKIYNERIDNVKAFRNKINIDIKDEALEKLHKASQDDKQKIIDNAIEAAKSGATLGEITRVIRSQTVSDIKIYPLGIHRGPEMFEVLRGSVERYKAEKGEPLKITLACFGRVSEYKAREDFSAGFFQTGGFETETLVVNDYKSAADEINKSKSPVVVICSTDDNYQEVVPSFGKTLKDINSKITLVLAGYPKDKIEEYQQAGIDEFIYMGANVYETLVKLSKKIGVRS